MTYLPATQVAQVVHEVAAAALYVPYAHSVQVISAMPVPAADRYLPAVQPLVCAVQDVAPEELNLSVAQSVHSRSTVVLGVVVWYLPAGQVLTTVQEVCAA